MDPVITVCLNPAVDRVLEVPALQPGRSHDGKVLLSSPAGKGINISRALSTLGVPSIVIGFAGADRYDEFEESINDRYTRSQLMRVEGTTRENITLVDSEAGLATHIRVRGLDLTEPQLARFERKLKLLARKNRVVVFAGSLPDRVDCQRFRSMVEGCVRSGARVVVDAEPEPLRAVRDLRLWLIKPSVEELAAVVDAPVAGDEDIVRYGLQLSRSIHQVLVTCGAAGAYVFVDGSAMLGQVGIEEGLVRSAVGSGDCMLAAFVAARLGGMNVKEAFRESLAAAVASGASVQPGRIDEDAITEVLFHADVEPLDRQEDRPA